MWSLEHYNLICYYEAAGPEFEVDEGTGTFSADRVLEYTDDVVKHRYRASLPSLAELPTLIVAEADPDSDQATPAGLVKLDSIRLAGKMIRFRFSRIQSEHFTSEEVFRSTLFETLRWESARTHWAVKEGNLVALLFKLLADRSNAATSRARDLPKPTIVRGDEWPLATAEHVGIMMPFDRTFDAVHTTIKNACDAVNLATTRVDDIFRPNVVMDDVLATIVKSRIVICDLSRRNPNVLYETGIAHAQGRDVIMIVQNDADIPFDLRHIRFIQYFPNGEGLEELERTLIRWLREL